MTDLYTPLPASTPVTTVGGKVGPIPDTAGNDAMGLVTDSPAANTLLGRMKALATAIGASLKVVAPDGSALATAAKQDTLATLAAYAGVAGYATVPAGSTNGTAIGTPPTGTRAVRLRLPAGASVSFLIASGAPGNAPTAGSVVTVTASNDGPNWDEPLAAGLNMYITAVSGGAQFRFI